MKKVNIAVEVLTHRNRPQVVVRRGIRYTVERVVDWWVIRGRWWHREERRVYFTLVTERGIIEVYHGEGGWVLSRVAD